ncbi:hypothetical protein C2845_PM06G28510 [Panicum miliaceum]|uniref:Uncharacterized protein n=1 Tax=Panicum miliaceum TaxID=4540 RepID=A0A3L6R8X8_PANMI|nr:hypothetical protein C2845_PM06G28510 [Panicum miliaceum]
MAPNKTIVAMLVIVVAVAACVPAVTSSETPAENKVLAGTTQGGASTSGGIITIQPSWEPWDLTRMPSTGKCLHGERGLASKGIKLM